MASGYSLVRMETHSYEHREMRARSGAGDAQAVLFARIKHRPPGLPVQTSERLVSGPINSRDDAAAALSRAAESVLSMYPDTVIVSSELMSA